MSYYDTTIPPKTVPLVEWARGVLVADADVQSILGVADASEAEDALFEHRLPAERPGRCGVVRELVEAGGRPVSMGRTSRVVLQVMLMCSERLPSLDAWHEAAHAAAYSALVGVTPSGAGLDAPLPVEPLTEPTAPLKDPDTPYFYSAASYVAVLSPTA